MILNRIHIDSSCGICHTKNFMIEKLEHVIYKCPDLICIFYGPEFTVDHFIIVIFVPG